MSVLLINNYSFPPSATFPHIGHLILRDWVITMITKANYGCVTLSMKGGGPTSVMVG